MKCPYCGQELTDEAVCPKCRAELPKKTKKEVEKDGN